MPKVRFHSEACTDSLDGVAGGADSLFLSNEDLLANEESHLTIAIADGVSGSGSGNVAAEKAIEAVSDSHARETTSLIDIFEAANLDLRRLSNKDDSIAIAETTMLVGLILNTAAHIGSVGDSRAYLFSQKNNTLERLTVDHNLAEETKPHVRKNQPPNSLRDDEFNLSTGRDVLTRALGSTKTLEGLSIRQKYIKPGELLLFCSDGLYSGLSDDLLGKLILDLYDEPSIGKCLIEKARQRGVTDDIAVVTVLCIEEE